MYWSVRRELWEHRSIYIAPLAAAAVFLLAFLTGLTLSPAHRHQPLDIPYEFAAALIMGTGFIVGIFYSLDALYGERRDRSILFWKSLGCSYIGQHGRPIWFILREHGPRHARQLIHISS
jgi:ABC-2 type transport system permease protein